ncbi:Thrombospondin type 1 domain [Popillia japonica]|uniref:Thrombospondin type 1 domain n=1 Tax=Popillia japonica TaxID=7064 RepID=A0AAW1JGQ7_POPJA
MNNVINLFYCIHSEAESGGWGPWTNWTHCSSTCIGGTKTRYRFCDSPPPRYGAKFCEVSSPIVGRRSTRAQREIFLCEKTAR